MSLFPSIPSTKTESDKLDELQQGSLFHSIEYELSGILDKINNINNLNEKEIRDIIIRQHRMILNYDLFLMSDETRSQAQALFTNKKFLRCFLDVIRLLDINEHEKICINKLAYDYYITPGNDQEVSQLLYQLTTEVNGREVIVLSGILGMARAQVVSMIKNSSFKEEKKVHRVNTYIVRCGDLSLQNIVDIYSKIFARFTNVFVYTMMEAKPANLTPSESQAFDYISIAMLEIMNSLKIDDIKKVLYDYAFTLNMVKVNTTVRFALRSAVTYVRIQQVIREIENLDNIIIP